MDRKKWRLRALAGMQTLAAVAIAGTILYLLYRYVQYGERFARETGSSRKTETLDSTAPEPETDETGQPSRTIRVCILTDDFSGEYHDDVILTCEKAFTIQLDGKRLKKRKTYRVTASELREGQVLKITQDEKEPLVVESLKRAEGHPKYAGTLWLYREVEGIVMVNELPLEEYLCGVVASEMPSDYPEEAQKAQAVCARTYACNCIRNARGMNVQEGTENSSQEILEEVAWSTPAADLDDSVNYQVYNNYQATRQSREAVEATEGEILPLDEIQYYSTSCQSEQRADLNSDESFRDFLSQEPEAGSEYDSPWLRWEVTLPAQDILQALSGRYGWQADRIDEICVVKRAGNGQAQKLEVRCGDATRLIEGEYAIRQVLSPAQTTIRLRDGEENSGMRLLPSAFFWLEPVRVRESAETLGPEEDVLPIDKVVLHGGGYGHGIGMSQCGAAAMAKKGLDYREILEYYYQCEVSG